VTDINNLDPHAGSTPSYGSIYLAFDHLTAYNDQLQPQPMLAESWDVSADLKQIKLNLRRNVQYHSGREFTSDDVKWNILRVHDPKNASVSFVNQSKWFTTIDTPDKYTVVLGSDQPRPAAFDFFEFINMADHETLEGPDAATKVIGTGPFVFKEWAQGDHITMTRNQSYWLAGRPYLNEVDVHIIKDPQAQIAQLEAGAVDLVLSPSLRDFARLRADSNYAGLLHPYAGTFYMQGVNVLNGPFDNKAVRQALSYAIDRKHIADSVLLGTGQPTSMPWLSNSAAYEASKDQFFTFDLDKAKSLLSQAGVSELTCQMLPIPSNPELVDMAQIYQADLAKIGVTLNITQVDAASWFDMANNRKYNGFYSTLNGLAQLEPITLLLGGRVYDPNSNNSGYQNDTYASLLNQAASEPDKSKRQALYSQINDILLDQAWAMPIAPAIRKPSHAFVSASASLCLASSLVRSASARPSPCVPRPANLTRPRTTSSTSPRRPSARVVCT
jgi:peptide/nickel transport system substrate-binding protein